MKGEQHYNLKTVLIPDYCSTTAFINNVLTILKPLAKTYTFFIRCDLLESGTRFSNSDSGLVNNCYQWHIMNTKPSQRRRKAANSHIARRKRQNVNMCRFCSVKSTLCIKKEVLYIAVSLSIPHSLMQFNTTAPVSHTSMIISGAYVQFLVDIVSEKCRFTLPLRNVTI